MYWTLELAYHLDDAPWPATKEELIDYAIRSCAPLEVVENLSELDDDDEIYANRMNSIRIYLDNCPNLKPRKDEEGLIVFIRLS